MTEILDIVLPLLAGVGSGVAWSTIGIWSKWRSGAEAFIDTILLRKNILVGAGTGVATFIYGIATNAETPVINSFETFVAAAAGYFTLVILVDKLLIKHEMDEDE